MAAVNFYKFAAAVMELLEPEKYNFSRKVETPVVAVPSDADDSFLTQILSTAAGANQSEDAGLISSLPTLDEPASAEAESQKVAMVTELLTNAVSNASAANLTQVAAAIKEASVPPSANSADSSNIPQTGDAAVKTIPTSTESAQLVQTTITALASQTTKQIKQAEVVTKTDEAANVLVKTNDAGANTRTAEAVTTAITDKIKQKTESADHAAVPVNNSTETVQNLNGQIEKPESYDFWELFPELDISGSKYYGEISDLYEYMKNGKLLDILNPANDLGSRYGLMTAATGKVGEKVSWEAETNSSLQKSRDDFEDKSREDDRAARNADKQKKTEFEKWQRQQQQKIAERLTAERLKKEL